jgi:hypothetical protein
MQRPVAGTCRTMLYYTKCKKDHKKTPQNEHEIELNSVFSVSQEGEGVSLGDGSPWLGVFAQVSS